MNCDCRIVGDLDIGIDGVSSINVATNTAVSKTLDGKIVVGPKQKTININAYPFDPGQSNKTGCAVKISGQFKWNKIYSCDDNAYYYIYQKMARISVLGDLPKNLVIDNLVNQGTGYSASAQSGPYSFYTGDKIGAAFSIGYSGRPISFDSASKESMVMDIGNVAKNAFLMGFTYTGGLGAIPTVNYRFEACPDAKVLNGPVVQCDSISINYDVHGVATISMIVYSNSKTLDVGKLPRVFDGVVFEVTGASVDLAPVPFSDCYKYNVTMIGIGK